MFVMLPGSGGATTALELLGPDDATWVGISGASGTTAIALPLELAPGTYRASVTGGTTPTGIYAEIRGVI